MNIIKTPSRNTKNQENKTKYLESSAFKLLEDKSLAATMSSLNKLAKT